MSAFRLIILVVAMLAAGAAAGRPLWGQSSPAAISIEAISLRGESRAGPSRLDVFARIPYTSLQFVKAPQGFSARYEALVEVYTADDEGRRGRLVDSEVWRESVDAGAFAETQAPDRFAYTTRSFALPPGRYRLEVRVADRAAERDYVQELVADVRDFSGAVALSDLVLLDEFDAAANRIKPEIADHIDLERSGFDLFYEVYSATPRDVRVSREILPAQKSRGLPVLRWFTWWRNDEYEEAITYDSEVTRLKPGRTPVVVTMPMKGLEVGTYLIRVKLEDSDGDLLAVAERSVRLEWSGVSDFMDREVDEAIAQLGYIAKKKELAFISEGKTRQERWERFQDFWKKRDPTPSTTQNERMDEYYSRVDFANRRYGSQAGWTTDRGHTLVLYGQPDNVERGDATVDVQQPYEVWHYRRIGKNVIFVDQTGTGDFRLLVPVWDERPSNR
jgi:GWxTD domain-containing protein